MLLPQTSCAASTSDSVIGPAEFEKEALGETGTGRESESKSDRSKFVPLVGAGVHALKKRRATTTETPCWLRSVERTYCMSSRCFTPSFTSARSTAKASSFFCTVSEMSLLMDTLSPSGAPPEADTSASTRARRWSERAFRRETCSLHEIIHDIAIRLSSSSSLHLPSASCSLKSSCFTNRRRSVFCARNFSMAN